MQDLRDALRALRANPLISAVAVLSLALGIGANTAIFSILNSLLLKPLPVVHPERLVALASDRTGEDAAMSYPVWEQVRNRRLLPEAFVWATDQVEAANGSETIALETIWASGAFFNTLGVTALAGRTFDDGDDRRSGGVEGPVAVVGYGLAKRRFGSPEAALGATLIIERVPFTIVGVTRPNFFGLDVGSALDIILPLEAEPLLGRRPPRLESRTWPWLHITSRLAPGGTVETATAAIRAAQAQIRDATMPNFSRAEDRDEYLKKPWTMRPAATGSSGLRSRYGAALTTLLGIVGVVLLIACANIAHLQLARIAARRDEFSVRAALGSSPLRIARGLLVESLVLSATGAALALAFAQWGGRIVVSQLSTWASTAFLDLSPDWRVLAVTSTVMVSTAALFGIAPALRAARVDPMEALKRQQRGLIGGTTMGFGGGLVVAQVALSLLLLVGAGLFVRSFAGLAFRDLGFDRGRVVVAVVDARRSTAGANERVAVYERLREVAGAVPGAESAATSMATPLGSAGVRYTPEVTMPENPAFAGRDIRILTNPVSPGWFRTYGTRLLAGRDFDDGDDASAAHVAIVNDAFARRYFGGSTPLGQTIIVSDERAAAGRRPVHIVGAIQDAAFTSVREPVEPTVYRPLAQAVEVTQLVSLPSICVSVRSAPGIPPARLTHDLANAISEVDGKLSVSFQTVTEQLSPYYIRERLLAMFAGFFGVLALLLAAVGLYGTTAYSMHRRRTEIGVRMALGADRLGVMRLVLGRVARLSGAGIAVGVVVALWATRIVEGLLFNTPARDPLTLAGAAAMLIVVSFAAGLLPARRATQIDVATALREG